MHYYWCKITGQPVPPAPDSANKNDSNEGKPDCNTHESIHIKDVIHWNQIVEEAQTKNIPIFVDFWAKWCKPCLRIGTLYDQLSSDYNGKAIFVKVNADECKDVVSFIHLLINFSAVAMIVGSMMCKMVTRMHRLEVLSVFS